MNNKLLYSSSSNCTVSYAPPGEYSESSAPPVSVAILNAVKQELDKHETQLKTQSTFAHLRDAIIDEK